MKSTHPHSNRPHCSPRPPVRPIAATSTLATAAFAALALAAPCGAARSAAPSAAKTAAQSRPRVRLVAVQMKVDLAMYRDQATFRAAMDRVVGAAAAKKAKTIPTLVALPEDVGLGLVFLGQWDTVKDAKSIREAGALLGGAMGPAVMEKIQRFRAAPIRALLLAVNDAHLRDVYFGTFRDLAKKHGVYLAAGSAPLSRPGEGAVRNVAVLFGPDGTVLNETAKVHLIDLEGPEGLDLVPGRVEDLGVVKTPFGTVGTAICYDGFHDDVLDHLTERGADIILQPSFNPAPWTKEQETDWATGLWARLKVRPSVAAGINPMMVGRLWDIAPEGQTSIVAGGAANGYLGRAASATEPTMVVVDLK